MIGQWMRKSYARPRLRNFYGKWWKLHDIRDDYSIWAPWEPSRRMLFCAFVGRLVGTSKAARRVR